MEEYWLITKDNTLLPIIISEESKEDFKELTNWSEEEFKQHTICRNLIEVKRRE